MGEEQNALFSPFEHNKITLDNRLVMAPMTRNMSPDFVPGKDVAAYYRRRAENHIGLIVTEGVWIPHVAAVGGNAIPAIHGDEPLEGWSRVVQQVHEVGGKIVPQLWHVGALRRPGVGPEPEVPGYSPSGIVKPGGKVVNHVMTESDIADVIEAFAKAAANTQRIGFDGLEIHGAHGYLIDQFFWSGTNLRSDRYGGDMAGRNRFAEEVIKAIRQTVGEDFLVILRFSQWKQQDFSVQLGANPDELGEFLSPLSDAGVDIFHCSTRRFWEPEFDGSALNLAGWTQKLSGKPAITVGSVGLDSEFAGGPAGAKATGIDELLKRLEAGEFDLVAVGRALLQDPEWGSKVFEERFDEIRDYDPASLGTLY
jgi:2,4-dienoyl-CoA reductase-like NADH-dependent reductase (Old Yellow Enzyme family)|tara:strand:+ start:2305 stop:3405 length:1101 start_codon:yes stop_codon:yes gene_type:complete